MSLVLGVPESKSVAGLLPNYIALGKGINAYKLDPVTLSPRSEPIFALDEGEFKEQGGFKIPKGCTYDPIHTGYVMKDSLVINTMEEYTKNFQQSGGFSVGVPGLFSFGLSQSYSKSNKSLTEKDETYVLAYGIQKEYSLSLEDSKEDPELKLSNLFVEDLTKLPRTWHKPQNGNELNEDPYYKFIKRFGTHYTQKVVFGGKIYQETIISKETREKLIKEKIDIADNSKAVIEGVEIDGKLSFENENTQKYYKMTEHERKKRSCIGGTLENNIIDFFKTVGENPLPISICLLPISDLLLSDQYFNSSFTVQDRNDIRKNLNNAIVDYCYQELECSKVIAFDNNEVADVKFTDDYQMVANQAAGMVNQFHWFNSVEKKSNSWQLEFYPGSGSIQSGKYIAGELLPPTVDCKVESEPRKLFIKTYGDQKLNNFTTAINNEVVVVAADDGNKILLWKGKTGEELEPLEIKENKIKGINPSISFSSPNHIILGCSSHGSIDSNSGLFNQEAHCYHINLESAQIESEAVEKYPYGMFEGTPDSGQLDVNVCCYQGSIVWAIGQRCKKANPRIFIKVGYITDSQKIKFKEKDDKENVAYGRFPSVCVLGQQVVLSYSHHSNNSALYKVGYQSGFDMKWPNQSTTLLEQDNELTPDGTKLSMAITSGEMSPLVAIGIKRKAKETHRQSAVQGVGLGILC